MASGIWKAAYDGDLAEVQRLVREDPGLLTATEPQTLGFTPLLAASTMGHVAVVRWILDKGVAVNGGDRPGCTPILFASGRGRTAVVRLLLERGADPTIGNTIDNLPLTNAPGDGYLEVVRLLLGHPSVKASINHRDDDGRTALWRACLNGRGGVVRALLESGADSTIADNHGITPTAVAKQVPLPRWVTAEGRRECVAALEVRSCLLLSANWSGDIWLWWQEAEAAPVTYWRQLLQPELQGAVTIAILWSGTDNESSGGDEETTRDGIGGVEEEEEEEEEAAADEKREFL
jgi:hypothetical protein